MKNITLLDCTLRDGGHITKGYFGEAVIKGTIRKLVESGMDIIEMGFLMEEKYSSDYARFQFISDIKRYLPEDMKNSKISLMADFVDLSNLEPCDGTVEIIRLSFKRHRWEWAINTAKILIEKGYKVFINPVNINVYSDDEILEAIDTVNELGVYGFSIVDTFGTLRRRDLNRLYQMVDFNLNKNIVIGLHLHENLGLSYSLAQSFIDMKNPLRNINIDCSLLGMGREPGNLHTEQIVSHMNAEFEAGYDAEPMFDAIDDYINPIFKAHPWGYSLPYALSAEYKLHRTYGEFLMGKWKLKTRDIKRILSKVDRSEAEMFNETYIENLYREYMSVPYDSSEDAKRLQNKLRGKEVLVIAPGASINDYYQEILRVSNSDSVQTISVNFIPDQVDVDNVFFTNIKRYETTSLNSEQVIITSNLLEDIATYEYAFPYKELVYHGEAYSDDSVLMLLNLLKQCQVKNVYLAGFDGFKDGNDNFYIDSFDRKIPGSWKLQEVKCILNEKYAVFDKLEFITPSQYQ